MKINKFFMLGSFLLVVTLLFPLMSAATAVVSPIVNTNYTTTVNLSLTTDVANCLSCSFWYDSTGAGGRTLLKAIVNTTDSQTEFEDAAFSITGLDDTITYNISANCTGDTDQESAGINPVTFDSTDPSISLVVQYDGESQTYGGILDYKCALSDAVDTTLATQSFSVAHPSGDATSSTTLTRNYATFLPFTDTNYEGDFVFTCSATDSTGNIGTDTATVTVGELGRVISVKKGSSGSDKTLLIVGILAIVLIWYFTKKK